jgi:pentatricopeptide repeat protein
VERFMESQPEDVDEVLVNSVLDVFCRLGDTPRLEATLKKMHEYNISGSAVTYGTILKAYGKAGKFDKVLQAWCELERVGLQPNAVTYGCMLDACVKCGHLDKALNVFASMKKSGLHKNTILYATLIKGFAKSKDPGAARELHREMMSEGVPCNVVVFNSLIDAAVRANDMHGAAEVLQEMTAAGVKPDLITFSTLIKGYCASGELSKAMRLADELSVRKLDCDEIVYNSLLEGCVKVADLQSGMRLFTEMKSRGVRPSSVTFSILVKLLAGAGRLDLALHLVATEMREMHAVAPTPMVWSCLITCCVKAHDLPRAVLVLDHLDRESTGNAAGARTTMYSTVIEGCLLQAEVLTALQLCERVCTRWQDAGRNGPLTADLLRRIFEAAGSLGHVSEAHRALEGLSAHLGRQVRASLEDALSRGSRQRSPRAARDKEGHRANAAEHGAGAAGGAAAPPPASVAAMATAAAVAAQQQQQQWPYNPYAAGYYGGHHWDPAVAAAAAAAAAAAMNPYTWQHAGMDPYYGAAAGAYGANPYMPQAWDNSMQWSAPLPEGPHTAAVAMNSTLATSPGSPAIATPGDRNGAGGSVSIDDATPEKTEDPLGSKVQTRLFAGEADATKTEAAPIERPPGLS